MKKFLKILFIIFLVAGVYNNVDKVLAEPVEEVDEFERLSDKKLNLFCPESGDPRLVSICGSVTQALESSITFSDGSTAPSVSQVPVEGVSVYLYECDNSSRSCKRDGLLVHPFSSTSTNKEGVFHLVGRKMENTWKQSYINQYTDDINKMEEDVTVTNQSKKRYLVFKCGKYFQGIHIIPSYMDLTEIIHEVNCPKEYLPPGVETFSYVPPLIQFDFIGGVKLAAQMGVDTDDQDYPLQRASHEDQDGDGTFDGIETTIQAHYDEYANKTNQSVQVILKGGDPRFTSPEKDAGKRQAIQYSRLLFASLREDISGMVPELGAWYAPDCLEKYSKYALEGHKDWSYLCGLSEEDLYKNVKKSAEEALLPTLPPKQSLLYYRPLEIRNEISSYYQDHDDLTKYLSMMFANPVGSVSKRVHETTLEDDAKPTYPDCEIYRAANDALGADDQDTNTLKANGVAQAFMVPGALDDLEDEADPNTPICLIDGETEPVLLKEIQRPGQLICEPEMRLCDDGVYWNNYFITNLGNKNNSLQLGMAGENKEDSYYIDNLEDGNGVNDIAFQKKREGEGEPKLGGQGELTSTDVTGNNSGGAMTAVTGLTSGTEVVGSTENLANAFGQDFVEGERKKELSSRIPYYVSTRPVAWGQFSKTNEYPEQIITNADQDKEYLDSGFFSKEMECESCGDEHYPEDLAEPGNPDIIGGKEGSGARTPFEGITVTTPSKIRTTALKPSAGDILVGNNWKDNYDSAISVSTGHSYIDWGMAKVKGKPTLKDAMSNLWNAIVSSFSGNAMKNKTFSDRTPDSLGEFNDNFEINDELVAFGFKVNAQNFEELFTCPNSCQDSPGCWGNDGDTGCYPWHPLGWGETCNTNQTECPVRNTSRTCRVDVCKKGIQHFIYTCQENPDGTLYKTVTLSETIDEERCSQGILHQCIGNQENSGIKPTEPTCTGPGLDLEEYRPFDYCTMSVAGPNECDGDILIDAEVQLYSQPIYDQDDLNSPTSYVADAVPESGLNLYDAFKDPYAEDIAPLPAAWVSVSSSLSETEPDVSLRKDFPGIGVGTGFLSRAQFGQPHSVSSLSELEPMYIHCENYELDGTEGEWDDGKKCHFATLPEPEIAEIEYLEEELEKVLEEKERDNKPTCMLNEDASECEYLVLGTSPSGEQLKFSDTFKLILNLTGNKFDVEPAAILVYMHKLGADKKYAFYWSEEGEEDLKRASLPWYGGFDFCDDLEPVKQPPYDFKLTWFSEMLKAFGRPINTTNSAGYELQTLFGRQETASRCNFIDSTFTLAGSLARSLYRYRGSIYEDILCPDQYLDVTDVNTPMHRAMKIQYYQLQINPKEEFLKGELFDKNMFLENNQNGQEYIDIWNKCK